MFFRISAYQQKLECLSPNTVAGSMVLVCRVVRFLLNVALKFSLASFKISLKTFFVNSYGVFVFISNI